MTYKLLELFIVVKNKRSTDFIYITMSLLKKVISKLVKPFAHICIVSYLDRIDIPDWLAAGHNVALTFAVNR